MTSDVEEEESGLLTCYTPPMQNTFMPKAAVAVLALTFLAAPAPIFAQTSDTTNEVTALRAQVDTLMQQVASLTEQVANLLPAGAVSSLRTSTGATTTAVRKGPICPLPQRSLIVGQRGEDVRQLQQYLVQQGHLTTDSVTGYYGSMTSGAVRQFQATNKVTTAPTGTVGPVTRAFFAQQCTEVPRPQPRLDSDMPAPTAR